MKFERISINPEIMLGKPCIKGTRITVELILEKLGGGGSIEYLLDAYPNITKEDILEAINYANAILKNEDIEEVLINVTR
ncbi:MAG TPA: DUF433 domain-containing protein [Parafilimonas sp.]|jgi:uncharacterized protein (DUF433 family)|nr:DUF433 domain-containing protein [Parafilimonas sp.]